MEEIKNASKLFAKKLNLKFSIQELDDEYNIDQENKSKESKSPKGKSVKGNNKNAKSITLINSKSSVSDDNSFDSSPSPVIRPKLQKRETKLILNSFLQFNTSKDIQVNSRELDINVFI